MHEVGLMQSALETAFAVARQQSATKIHRLTLRVGALSGVVPDALSFAFDALAPGTPAEGGWLEIQTVPVACYCADCGIKFAPETFFYSCPECGKESADVREGRELEVRAVEVS